jgi:hypothetical protein
MVAPVVTVTLGGTDISARCSGPGASLVYGRGASFDGANEAPGFAHLYVENQDRAFDPRNASSPIFAQLKIGKPVRIVAVHSAVTYYLFHGFLRSISPDAEGFAVLRCEDALFNFSRRRADVAASATRSIAAFRAALLDDIGEISGNRNLDIQNGAEAVVVYTGADDEPVAGVLAELNHATGAVHFIKPTSTAYQYTTLDRLTLQSSASQETWSDTDMATPFAESLAGFDYSDERIINYQRVEATPRLLEDDAVRIWERDRWHVGASLTRRRWARFDDPSFSQTLNYEVAEGSATVNFTPFARSAKIEVIAGAGGVVLRDLRIWGRRALEAELDAGEAEDSTSITAYGELPGSTISSEYISAEPYADALAGWYIYRYKDPRAQPGPTFVNRFPTQLVREIGQRVTLTAAEQSLSAVQCLIRSFTTRVSESGARWETSYQLEEMPAAVDLFTIGGTAGQGVGGTGILGY